VIVFIGEGQLGNQIFQYAFIKSIIDKRSSIISINFKELSQVFGPLPDVKNINNHNIARVFRRFVAPTMELLGKIRVISLYKVNRKIVNGYSVEDIGIKKTRGILPVHYISSCYVQSESFFDKSVINELKVNDCFVSDAKKFLGQIPHDCTKVFVHIRRGDYIAFMVYGKKDVSLPASYYREQIESIKKDIENPFFVFLTDDPGFVECCFEDLNDKVISNNNMFVDFAIMLECDYGIMSNSSFCWWGGYFMHKRKKLYAPRYWLGWKSKEEYQIGCEPTFATLVDVYENH